MKKGLWNKRIPTLFAFLLLFLGLGVTTYFIQQRTDLTGLAAPDKEPQNVIISNIDDKSFTVNFTTNSPTTAAISYEGGGKQATVAFDSKENSGSHLIKVENLNPLTTYQFSILSDGETYLLNGQKYSVTTGPTLEQSNSSLDPVNGTILLEQGGAANDTIVEITINGSQTLTTLTKDDGTFNIPLDSMRVSNLSSYLEIKGSDKIIINAFRTDSTTEAQVRVENSSNIPPITLTEKYNFTGTTTEQISTSSSQLISPENVNTSGIISINTPIKDQTFIDNRPRFTGLAVPNSEVKVTINPGSTDTVTSNANGAWTFRPTIALLPGSYKLTIQSNDQTGVNKTVTQTFAIFSSGSQLSPNATLSATPTIRISPTKTPTLSPTKTPTPTVKISPSITLTPSITTTPTLTPSISPTPTVIITLTPTPTITSSPTLAVATPPPPPPVSGSGTTTVVLTTISLLLIFAGSALIFLL